MNISGGVIRAFNGFGIPRPNEPKPDRSFKAPHDPVHVNEDTGQPCTYCMIPASSAERAYYDCVGVPKPERNRRLTARDYGAWSRTVKGQAITAANREQAAPREVVKPPTAEMTDQEQRRHLALCDGVQCERQWCGKGQAWRQDKPEWRRRVDEGGKIVVQAGTGPETATRTDGTQQAVEGHGAVPLPVLLRTDRTGTEAQGVDDGAGSEAAAPVKADAKAYGTVAARIERLRQRLRSGSQLGGETDRTGSEVPDGSIVLPTLQATYTVRVGARDEVAVAKAQSKLKRGRPRKHATVADRKRAYRERKRGTK